MFRVKFDTREINRILNNSVSYSYGFLEGAEQNQIFFNKKLAEYTEKLLGEYIDAQARVSPESLHHVYEWNRAGDKESRLFTITSSASKRVIHLSGSFLPSKSVSETSTEPFTNKAEVMENGISILIEPKNSDYLVFEDDGQTVFTTKSIVIENPGGDLVAGSFGRVVSSFFDSYFSNALLQPLIQELATAEEFSINFKSGTKSGKSAGIRAGRSYIMSVGDVVK